MDNLISVLIKTAAVWEEQGALARFRRALRRRDQLVLDDLLQFAPDQPGDSFLRSLPVELVLLRMLLEEQKELHAIREGLHEFGERYSGDG